MQKVSTSLKIPCYIVKLCTAIQLGVPLILVSYHWYNKLLKSGWLKTTEITLFHGSEDQKSEVKVLRELCSPQRF